MPTMRANQNRRVNESPFKLSSRVRSDLLEGHIYTLKTHSFDGCTAPPLNFCRVGLQMLVAPLQIHERRVTEARSIVTHKWGVGWLTFNIIYNEANRLRYILFEKKQCKLKKYLMCVPSLWIFSSSFEWKFMGILTFLWKPSICTWGKIVKRFIFKLETPQLKIKHHKNVSTFVNHNFWMLIYVSFSEYSFKVELLTLYSKWN
jgi:hypothetical protein